MSDRAERFPRSRTRLALLAAALSLLYATCFIPRFNWSSEPAPIGGTQAEPSPGREDPAPIVAPAPHPDRFPDKRSRVPISASLARAPKPPVAVRAAAPRAGTPMAAPDAVRLTAPAALPSDYQTSIPPTGFAPEPQRSTLASDAGLYELQLGRLVRRVVRVRQPAGNLLVSAPAFLDLAEIKHQVIGGRITGRLEPSGERFTIDPAAHEVRLGNRVVPVGPHDITADDGETYVSLPVLRELFGISGTIDRESAAVYVYDPEDLPIARRMEREAARAILIGGERSAAPDLVLPSRGGEWNGVVVTYDLRSSSQSTLSASAYDIAAATAVAGGSVFLRAQGAGQGSPRFDGAWTGIWPLNRWLTQLRAGDGVTTGPRPQISRGVSVTNAPFARPLLVEDMPFAGTLPPDWSLEAYRGGQLIAFDSVGPSGRYLLTLPVQYGENPIDFVAYGPFGQVRTFNRTFRALPSMLPPGAFEYGVSAGACRSTVCSRNGNADLRYGLSRRWTVRAGLDEFWRDGAPSISHPYAGIAGAPANALGLEAEGVAHAFVRGGIRVEPSLGLRLTADYVQYADSSGASPFVPPGTRRLWSLYGRVTPSQRNPSLAFEAQGTRTETTSGTRSEARVGASALAANMLLRPYARADRVVDASGRNDRRYVGLEATILPRPALGPVLGAIWAQGQFEAEDVRRPTSASVTLARNLGSIFRVEGGVRWARGFPGALFTFSLVSQLAAIRSTSLVTAPTSGEGTRLDQSLAGSVVWSRNAAVALYSEPTLDRGGITGRVFLDVNGDGSRQEGEPVLPGTRLLVGNRWRTADAEGRFQVWGLSPYEEVVISTDTTSLASPWWVPGFGSATVLPTSNVFRKVDIPVVIGGIVEGSLLLDGATSLPADRALAVILVEAATGRRTSVETFSDGSFYRAGVRPGRYTASVDSAVLAALHLTADTVRFVLESGVPATGKTPEQRREAALRTPGATVSGLRIVLRRARASPTDSAGP
jgi:hypothetical protein